MDYRATLRNAAVSAQKCRLVADAIRGRTAQQADDALTFGTHRAERIVRKLLNSALANAQNNFGADVDELKVSTICVDVGPKIGRIRPRARGRASPYNKHRCHVRIVLSDGRRPEPLRPAAAPDPEEAVPEQAPGGGPAAPEPDAGTKTQE